MAFSIGIIREARLEFSRALLAPMPTRRVIDNAVAEFSTSASASASASPFRKEIRASIGPKIFLEFCHRSHPINRVSRLLRENKLSFQRMGSQTSSKNFVETLRRVAPKNVQKFEAMAQIYIYIIRRIRREAPRRDGQLSAAILRLNKQGTTT